MLESRPCPCPMIRFHGLSGESGAWTDLRHRTGSRDELIGFPGSPGIAQGTVKVVREVSDAGKLNPGDILVTEYTLPSWTPLFARTAALVTDSGGVLSHSAVVAREYGIPTVVGTGTATAVIRDGQVIEVDGTAGRVRMVSQNDNMQL